MNDFHRVFSPQVRLLDADQSNPDGDRDDDAPDGGQSGFGDP